MKTPADIHDGIDWRELEDWAAVHFTTAAENPDSPAFTRGHAEHFRELATLLLLRQQTIALQQQAAALERIAEALNPFGAPLPPCPGWVDGKPVNCACVLVNRKGSQ